MSYDIKQVICIRKDLNMRKGKMCAQVAHASMKFLVDMLRSIDNYNSVEVDMATVHDFTSKEQEDWLFNGKFAKVVVSVDSEQELLYLIELAEKENIVVCPIVDSGLTEFHGNATLTCAAFGPDKKEKLDKITGHLKLL